MGSFSLSHTELFLAVVLKTGRSSSSIRAEHLHTNHRVVPLARLRLTQNPAHQPLTVYIRATAQNRPSLSDLAGKDSSSQPARERWVVFFSALQLITPVLIDSSRDESLVCFVIWVGKQAQKETPFTAVR